MSIEDEFKGLRFDQEGARVIMNAVRLADKYNSGSIGVGHILASALREPSIRKLCKERGVNDIWIAQSTLYILKHEGKKEVPPEDLSLAPEMEFVLRYAQTRSGSRTRFDGGGAKSAVDLVYGVVRGGSIYSHHREELRKIVLI